MIIVCTFYITTYRVYILFKALYCDTQSPVELIRRTESHYALHYATRLTRATGVEEPSLSSSLSRASSRACASSLRRGIQLYIRRRRRACEHGGSATSVVEVRRATASRRRPFTSSFSRALAFASSVSVQRRGVEAGAQRYTRYPDGRATGAVVRSGRGSFSVIGPSRVCVVRFLRSDHRLRNGATLERGEHVPQQQPIDDTQHPS